MALFYLVWTVERHSSLDPRQRSVAYRITEIIGKWSMIDIFVVAILGALVEPIMSSTLQLPGDDFPLNDARDIDDRIGNLIEMIVDGGSAGLEPTSVIDLSKGSVEVLRVGKGDVSSLG